PLMREFEVEESQSRISSTAIAQPCLFVLQVALARLWQSWGVQPDVVIGHSVGEIAAAHLAGALSLEEAFRVVYHRGRCMDRASSHGRMLAAALPEDEARRLIARWDSAVVIAAVNSPSLVSLSGQ